MGGCRADVVVSDSEGAGLVQAAFLDHVVAEAPEQERVEGWIMEQGRRAAQGTGGDAVEAGGRATEGRWRECGSGERG